MVKADNNLLPLEWIGHSFNFPVEWAQNISHESLVECALNLAKELVEKQEDLKTRIEKWKTQNAFEKNVLLAKKSKDKGNTYYSKNKFKVALEAYGEVRYLFPSLFLSLSLSLSLSTSLLFFT